MSDLERWQQTNDVYLSRALHWLRLRLAQQVPPLERTLAVPEPSSRRNLGWCRWFRRKPPQSHPPEASIRFVRGESLEAAAAAMAEAANASPVPALIQLAHRFGLSEFEQQVLLLCVAMELDPQVAKLCARVQGMPEPGYPTFALALGLFDYPAWDVMSPERPLRFWRMLEINQPGA
ncbi:MAG: hypothetical protein LH647_02835 [Leptolyngbyaceae cyanobacterium CAN_BIN12]|nr:hypothetical protein [Leptolyngbyaceae cyanobacterium CAN_BIN12]